MLAPVEWPITYRSRRVAVSIRSWSSPRAPSSAHSAARRSPKLACPVSVVASSRARSPSRWSVSASASVSWAAPISNRSSAHATCGGRSATLIAVKNSRNACSSPAGSIHSPPRGRVLEPIGTGCQRAWSDWRQPGATSDTLPGAHSRIAVTTEAKRAAASSAGIGSSAGTSRSSTHRSAVRSCGPSIASPRASERPSPSSTRSACIHAPGSGAITRARTASRYSVSSTSPYTRSKRSSGKPKLVASSYSRSSIARSAGSACSPRNPFTRSHAEAPAPSSWHAASRDGQLAQPLPALLDERAGARLVAVQGGPAAAALVDDVELDLGAALQFVGQ